MTFAKILQWIFSIIGALSCWWMAFAIYRALHSGQELVYGIPIMFLYLSEFILIHAGSIPMIAASNESKSAKISTLAIVSLIYIAFIAAIVIKVHSVQLLLTFAGVMIPRWTGFFTDSDNVRQQQIARSLESMLAFVFIVVPIGLLSNDPNPFGPALSAYFAVMGLLEGTMDEERRLFYVAVTRAMLTLAISHCGGRKKYGQLLPCHPSPFLKELPEELVEHSDSKNKTPVAQESGKSLFAAMRESIG